MGDVSQSTINVNGMMILNGKNRSIQILRVEKSWGSKEMEWLRQNKEWDRKWDRKWEIDYSTANLEVTKMVRNFIFSDK